MALALIGSVTLQFLKQTELLNRINVAKSALQSLLDSWDVDETDRVGFEILVPSLLQQISGFDIWFEFPDRERLMQLDTRKMEFFYSLFDVFSKPNALAALTRSIGWNGVV